MPRKYSSYFCNSQFFPTEFINNNYNWYAMLLFQVFLVGLQGYVVLRIWLSYFHFWIKARSIATGKHLNRPTRPLSITFPPDNKLIKRFVRVIAGFQQPHSIKFINIVNIRAFVKRDSSSTKATRKLQNCTKQQSNKTKLDETHEMNERRLDYH